MVYPSYLSEVLLYQFKKPEFLLFYFHIIDTPLRKMSQSPFTNNEVKIRDMARLLEVTAGARFKRKKDFKAKRLSSKLPYSSQQTRTQAGKQCQGM